MAGITVSDVTSFVNENNPIHVEFLNGETPVVSSLEVVRHFQKKHQHVLRDIDRICPILPKSFAASNFGRSEYPDSTGRKLPAYLLTRDAFSLVVMGFTGKEALAWKVRYIEAFNAMEASLRSPASLPSVRSRAYTLPAEPYLRLNTAQMQALRSAPFRCLPVFRTL